MPDQPAKAKAKAKPAAPKPAPAPAVALEALELDALVELVEDDAQPDELRAEAGAILERRQADRLEAAAPPTINAKDEAGARLELVRAIAAAMGDVARVVKDRTNTDHHYKFATVESMLKAVRGPLFARGVILMAHPGKYVEREMVAKSGTKGTVVDLTLDFTFTNGVADYLVAGWPGQGVDYSDKAGSKALTMALKTFVRVQWLLPAETDDDPDRTSPEGGYGRAPAAAELPAWAQPADAARSKQLGKMLAELIGPERTAALSAATRDTFGTVPEVLVGFTVALAAHLRAEHKPALEARAKVREEERAAARAKAEEEAAAKATAAAQDKAAEAPDPPAPDVAAENEALRRQGETRAMCGAHRQGLVCVKPAGHAHRGDEDHATTTGTFPDDELVSYGPAPGQLGLDAPAAPANAITGDVDDDTPSAGTVPMPDLDDAQDGAEVLARLRAAGCSCPDPLNDDLDTINCPLVDHGIPF